MTLKQSMAKSIIDDSRERDLVVNSAENIKYINRFNSSTDLIEQWYNIDYNSRHVLKRREFKLQHIYGSKKDKVYLKGHGLEMAFGFGESIYVLMQWYKDITLDALDFNPLLTKIVPYIKTLNGDRLKDIWIGDAQNIPKSDNYYDFINSCSFFEHLSEGVYWNILTEAYRVLKRGGYLGVYVDVGKNGSGEHIRCVPLDQTKKELCQIGFSSINNYLYIKE